MSERILDLAGIGIGPSNLSIAALLREIPGARAEFFEQKPRFDWHPGLLFQKAQLQTSFLKDLVTSVCPTSPYSFINYIVQSGRFYQFLSADMDSVGRQEFTDYMAWVARHLPSLHFGTAVEDVAFAGDHFVVTHAKGVARARSVTLGTGRAPHVPACAQPFFGDRCFHGVEILTRMPNMRGLRVAVVGGGQSGGEVFLHALQGLWGRPRALSWVSRRPTFGPLDETPFANELFTPAYVRMFHRLSEERRRSLVGQHKLLADGISVSTLREIYRELYEQRAYAQGLLPGRALMRMSERGREFGLGLSNAIDGSEEQVTADLVILCTGFCEVLPRYLEGLRSRLHVDAHGKLSLSPDFAVEWDGPSENRIYGLNIGRYSHGVAEPQLSVMAWRSAVIVNHLLGEEHFDLRSERGLLDVGAERARAGIGPALVHGDLS